MGTSCHLPCSQYSKFAFVCNPLKLDGALRLAYKEL